MMNIDNEKKKEFGIVYTPDGLGDFVAELLLRSAKKENINLNNVLDPSCGKGSLLNAMKRNNNFNGDLYGVDLDKSVINFLKSESDYNLIHNNMILPKKTERVAEDFWKNELPPINGIIANPPWSTVKSYSRKNLEKAGYSLSEVYNDIYALFIELSIKILSKDGLAAFIIPDSIFEDYNLKLRKFLTEETEIKVIARLGEKIFKGVNRATTVIVIKKTKPKKSTRTTCFRLDTNSRNIYLKSDAPLITFFDDYKHSVYQKRFALNENYVFDIDTREEEEFLISKLKLEKIDFQNEFIFGRGVEINKKGEVVICPYCNNAQGFTKSQVNSGIKSCNKCKNEIHLKKEDIEFLIKDDVNKEMDESLEKIFVGENINRYGVTGHSYIKLDVPGINYKAKKMYTPPKILIRKTGLGIYSCVDHSQSFTTQTVYILKYKNHSNIPLEYYVALLNSRVVYYYYLKVYGENEWKSHPYLTKRIIFSLPIKKYEKNKVTDEIIKLSKQLTESYSYEKDLLLERLVMKWYNINIEEQKMILAEINKLPDLGAVEQMKVRLDV